MNYLYVISFAKLSVLHGRTKDCNAWSFDDVQKARLHSCLRLAEELSAVGMTRMLTKAILGTSDREYERLVRSSLEVFRVMRVRVDRWRTNDAQGRGCTADSFEHQSFLYDLSVQFAYQTLCTYFLSKKKSKGKKKRTSTRITADRTSRKMCPFLQSIAISEPMSR